MPADPDDARLREQQSLLETLMRYFPGVVIQLVSTGPDTYDFSLVSEGCFDLLELSPETLRADSEAFFRLLMQPDGARAVAHLERADHARAGRRTRLPALRDRNPWPRVDAGTDVPGR